MLIVQNEFSSGGIQNGLSDLMRGGVSSVCICSAYMSIGGSEILFDAIRRTAERSERL
jgi:hypothetical protein